MLTNRQKLAVGGGLAAIGLAASLLVTSSAPTGKPAECANEPVGSSVLANGAFDAMPPVMTSTNKYNWYIRQSGSQNLAVSGGVLRGRFQKDAVLNGGAPFSVGIQWKTPAINIYSCQIVRTSAPWQMSPDIVGNKFSFFLFVSNSGNNGYTNLAKNVGLNTQHASGTGKNQNSPAAFPVGLLGDGKFHALEFFVQGNPNGDSTGVVTIWLDGVQKLRWTGVQFYGHGPAGVIGMKLEPTHGGCKDTDGDDAPGPCTNYVQQDILLDHWYISTNSGTTTPPPPPVDTTTPPDTTTPSPAVVWTYTDSVPTSYRVTDSAPSAYRVTDSVPVTWRYTDSVPSAYRATDSVPTAWRYTDSVQVGAPPPPPPTDTTPPPPPPPTSSVCANTPAGFTVMTRQDFSVKLPQNAPDASGWMEEASYQKDWIYANGIGTGTWPVGLLWGRGPYNVHFRVAQARRDMHTCERFKLDSAMAVPNPLLKEDFYKSGNATTGSVNHVAMWIPFPQMHVQFGTVTGPDGYVYKTHRYCLAGTQRDAGDQSVYTVKPAAYINLRDGRWHEVERTVYGGTPGHGDGAITVRLDGKVVCQTTGVRWYAPGWLGTMNGKNLNPNSAGGSNSWAVEGHVSYDYYHAWGR